jgi:hypothetical protein
MRGFLSCYTPFADSSIDPNSVPNSASTVNLGGINEFGFGPNGIASTASDGSNTAASTTTIQHGAVTFIGPTPWDPSASTDMQALLDVFDTNHDGSHRASRFQ